MNKTSNKKGFTIIEVVLVLAIAGLIFLLVFLALPALQRGQRDTQRKNDLGKFMSQVVGFQSNNQGSLPTNWGTFVSDYLTVNSQPFADPSTGNTYTVTVQTNHSEVPSDSEESDDIFVYLSATCGAGSITTVTPAANRTFAAAVYQEQGGFSCQDNR